jgi:hypothetical protein
MSKSPPRLYRYALMALVETDHEYFGFEDGFYGGSRVICDPAPTDTDCDVCMLVRSAEYARDILVDAGWDTPDLEEYDGDTDNFYTVRKGEFNILIFEDPVEYGAVLAATCIAMDQNLLVKADRYALFTVARSTFR